ncbi:hypothetical protein GYB62_01180, partial [bacterium]|nr:hypothetical protein [bacterium]
MTSLINQVVNELERKEQATQTPELPLFAAADGLQRRRRMRAAIVAIAATGVALTASAMYLSDLKQKIPPIGDVAPLAVAGDKLALSVESTSPVVVPVDKKISHFAQRQELLVSEVIEKSGSHNDQPLTSAAKKAERGAVDSRELDTTPKAAA